MPKISVIMPAYNGEKYIGSAIASVLAQSETDLELIIVNDGSTDRTQEIIEGYAKNDQRIKYSARQNSGHPATPKNDGLAQATGEYLCFLDQDDLYDPERIRCLSNVLDNHPEWIAAFHDLRLIDGKGNRLPGTYLATPRFLERASEYMKPLTDDWFECDKSFYVYQSLFMGAIHTQSVIIAKNRLPEGSIYYDTQYNVTDDTDQWIRLGMLGKIGFLNRVLSSYRIHELAVTYNREKMLLDALRMHQNNYARVSKSLTKGQQKHYRVKISNAYCELGYIRYLQYRQEESRQAYRSAMNWSISRETLSGYLKSIIPGKVVCLLKNLCTFKIKTTF